MVRHTLSLSFERRESTDVDSHLTLSLYKALSSLVHAMAINPQGVLMVDSDHARSDHQNRLLHTHAHFKDD